MTDARRGHNEGSIYPRADGRWVGAVSLGMVNGKRKRKVVYGKTRQEVVKKVRKIQSDLDRGLPVQSSSMSVAAFLKQWLETVKPTLRPRTFKSYTGIVERHLAPGIGRHRLEKLTQRHVNQLLSAKLEEGLSARSVHNIRNVLRAALNQAMRWDLVGRNVAALADPPKAETYEPYALSAKQATRFLDAVKDDRLEALYALVLSTGLRQGEVLGLRWDDVDLDKRAITVRKQLQVIDGAQVLTDPKSARSKRTIPLLTSVVELLRQHKKNQLEERLLAGGKWQTRWNLVFTTPIGTPIDHSNLRKHFKGIVDRIGLRKEIEKAGREPIRFHDLRHSAASFLAARGVHPSTAQAILGHANVNTTLSVYTHVNATTMREAVDLMEDLFRLEKEAK